MPKKSKREKQLADIRRRARTERVVTVPLPSSPITTHSETFQFRATTMPKPQEIHVQENTTELVAIKKDLTKTAILSIIAIASEIILFWFERW